MAFPRGKKLWMERNQGQNRESQHREKVHEVPHKRQFQLKRHESSLGSFHRKEGSCVKAVGCFSQLLCASKAPICKPQSGTIYMMVRMAFPQSLLEPSTFLSNWYRVDGPRTRTPGLDIAFHDPFNHLGLTEGATLSFSFARLIQIRNPSTVYGPM